MKARESMESKSQGGNGENLQEVFPLSVWTAWARRGVPEQPWNFSETTTCLFFIQGSLIANWMAVVTVWKLVCYHLAAPPTYEHLLHSFISVVNSMKCSPISTRKAMNSFHCCVEAHANLLCAFFFSPKIMGNGKQTNKKTPHILFSKSWIQ